MTPRFLTFIRLLRDQGVRISVAESLDALDSVQRVGVHDRDLLRLSLRTTLVKSYGDFATFDTLFERFFTVPARRKRRRKRQHPGSDGTGKRPSQQADGPPTSQSPLQPSSEAPPSPQQTKTPPGTHAETLAALHDLEQAWQQQLTARPARTEATPEHAGTQAMDTRIDREFPPDRLADMYREVEQLTTRLLARRALRYRRARHGRLDLRRTVLHGLRSGNEVPFNLIRRQRKISKLRLLVLCDVSGSVWQVSTFFLKLVHTLQAEFTSVRSLLFVNSIVEVTELFRRIRFPDDLDALRHYPNLNLFGFSDFGRAFYQLYRDHLNEMTRETVVVILGDARNNAFDAQFWTLEEIRQRCCRIIWLNPEPRRIWDTEDSIIAVYEPFCDDVLECWTLEHLAQAADLLLQI